MLTKDHVQCRLRKERLSVHWLSSVDRDAVTIAHQLIRLHQESTDLRYEELIAKSREIESLHSLNEAFLNVLEQRLVFLNREDDAETRWTWWEKAQNLRQQNHCDSMEQYQHQVASVLGVPFSELGARLYADVPEQRTIRRFRNVTSEALLKEYNFCQMDFFLSEADEISIKFPRKHEQSFFAAMARSSLSPIYKHDGKQAWRGTATGPAHFSGKNAKALHTSYLAFMAQLHSLSEWQLDIRLQWKGKPATLTLDEETLKLLNMPKAEDYALFSAPSLRSGRLVSYAQECYVYADFLLFQEGKDVWGKVFYPWQADLLEECLNNAVFTSKSVLLLENGLKPLFKKKIETFRERVLWFDQTPDEQAIIAYQDALPVHH